jgi:uncharacterized membrane protein YbhN (UPF0104 family)
VTTKRLSNLSRLAISAALLVLLFWRGGADLGGVVDVIRQADPRWLLGSVLSYAVLGSVVRGARWRALVRALGHPFRLLRATELFLVGTFFNQLLPTGFGGDVVRTVLLGRDGPGGARAASTVIVDRAIGILMLLPVGMVALLVTRGQASAQVAAVLLAAVVAGLAGSLVLLSAHRWRERAAALPLVGRLATRPAIARFTDSFAEYGRGPLAVAAAWSTVFTGLLIGANVCTARALGIDQATIADWCLIVPLVSLSALLPSVGGWGVREWTYVGLLGALSPPVPSNQATAMSVVFGAMNLLVAAVGGLLIATHGSMQVRRRELADASCAGPDTSLSSMPGEGSTRGAVGR